MRIIYHAMRNDTGLPYVGTDTPTIQLAQVDLSGNYQAWTGTAWGESDPTPLCRMNYTTGSTGPDYYYYIADSFFVADYGYIISMTLTGDAPIGRITATGAQLLVMFSDTPGIIATIGAQPSLAKDQIMVYSLQDLEISADPTGVVDATAAFQAAISTGRPVRIPVGTYTITSTLTPAVGTRIYGEDRHKSILNYTGTGKLFALPAGTYFNNSIVFENFSIQGPYDLVGQLPTSGSTPTPDSTVGIGCDSATGDGTPYSVFRDLDIGGFSFGINGNMTTSLIDGCTVAGCYYGLDIGDGTSGHSNFVTVQGKCKLNTNWIHIRFRGNGFVQDCDIENGPFADGTLWGVGLIAGTGVDAKALHIEQLKTGISLLGQSFVVNSFIGGCTVAIDSTSDTLPLRFNGMTVVLPAGAVIKNPIYAFKLGASGKKIGTDIEVFTSLGGSPSIDDWSNIANGVDNWNYTTMN